MDFFNDVIVSMCESAQSVNTQPVKVQAILSAIRVGRWREQVEHVRAAYANGGKDAAQEPKKALPGVMFSGKFSHRRTDALLSHSGLLCIDLDGLNGSLLEVRRRIETDSHTLACFLSATGSGLKVLVPIETDAAQHLDSFRAAERYYKNVFGLTVDPQCKDLPRLCFVSYDPLAFINDDAVKLEPLPADKPQAVMPPPAPARNADPTEEEDRIRNALPSIPAGDYDTWTKIGMALHSWDPQRGFALWDQWSHQCPEKYDERQLPKKWASFKDRAGGVTLGTLFEHAKHGGWSLPPSPRVTLGGMPTAPSATSKTTTVWPAAPDEACYHGLAGEIVRAIDPHTEADPLAVLIQLLVFFGNCIGRAPYFLAEADRHGTNEFALLVGETSKGRKGTSAGHVRRLFEDVNPVWTADRIASGLSSGEGLVWAVRDAIVKIGKDGQTEIIDPGESDKRLIAMESEFASTLHAIERQGNTLSACIRNLWDSGNVRTLTKNSPARTTDAHVSIVGHITRDELLRYMTRTELGNGFANRFMFVCVRRSKVLPEGGNLQDETLWPLVHRLKEAVQYARTVNELKRDPEARELWIAVYPKLSEGKRGLLGSILSRSEAHTMRLACIYALLDQSNVIRREHLLAALALWEYAEESAAWVFGDSIGDPEADTILRQLRLRPDGMTRTEINDQFRGHRRTEEIERAITLLTERGYARREMVKTGGRDAERWVAV